MEGKAILLLLGVVCWQGTPSRGGDAGGPMAERAGPGVAAPEVVLQLKYERGALDRVYLAQYRQRGGGAGGGAGGAAGGGAGGAVPSAAALCADLCYSGLGGESCGASCADMTPVGLATALRSENQSTAQYGQPRVAVCPALCANRLGTPLCNCPADQHQDKPAVDWGAVCDVFCLQDGYVLGGCPACKEISIPPLPAALAGFRQLDTAEGWVSWCNVQCRQGHGGAACNCDRAPFQ